MIGQYRKGRRYESWLSNLGIGVALFAMFADLTLATGSDGAAQVEKASAPAASVHVIPPALNNKERWNFFLDETFRSYGPYVVSLGAGVAYQAIDYPREWGGGLRGFGLRSASQYGLLLTQNSIHDGGEAALGYEPRYFPCQCTGVWRRTGHALEMTFLTYDQHGHKRLDLPQLVGAYGSGMLSAFWYPKGFSPLVQGVQTGHMQFGFVMGTHLFQEFSPEIKRVNPLRKIFNRSSEKTH
jgi:hypothetical protein